MLNSLKDKKIAIWGMGIEGNAVLFKLNSIFPDKKIDILNDENAKSELKKMYDFVIRSPGVSIYKNEIIEAKKNGTIFITEKSILYSELKNSKVRSIGITGTKGKTTTSTFCAYILQKMGFNTILTGNMGVPTITLLDEIKKADFVVTELSSYQASDLIEFPNVGILLNLYPEHIDWHKTHENYYRDKKNLLKGVDIAISYDTFDNMDDIVFYKDEWWFYKEKKLWTSKNMKLLGEHNYKNLSFVFTALLRLKLDLSIIKQEYLNEFSPIEHRLEIIDKNGIRYVNDSISTIPEATIACFKTFKDKNIYSILGGYDRQQNYIDLVNFVKNNNNIKYIAIMGQNGEKIANEFKNNNYKNFEICDNLEKCIVFLKTKIKENKDNNSALLLSPAAPSYGIFKNFEERGRIFKEII
jgi:UDP-N-acetylmuramoylalanine--D-glutamate ligase